MRACNVRNQPIMCVFSVLAWQVHVASFHGCFSHFYPSLKYRVTWAEQKRNNNATLATRDCFMGGCPGFRKQLFSLVSFPLNPFPLTPFWLNPFWFKLPLALCCKVSDAVLGPVFFRGDLDPFTPTIASPARSFERYET